MLSEKPVIEFIDLDIVLQFTNAIVSLFIEYISKTIPFVRKSFIRIELYGESDRTGFKRPRGAEAAGPW